MSATSKPLCAHRRDKPSRQTFPESKLPLPGMQKTGQLAGRLSPEMAKVGLVLMGLLVIVSSFWFI
ncbi:MAG: hypothetical protein Q8P33_01910 [bacterium]|nr:hypothetical protein [bacterium]